MRAAFLIALAAGIVLGLIYAWLINPVEFTTADPSHLEPRYREAWVVLSAEAYVAGGDWERTRLRLDGLEDPNLAQTVGALFERYNTGGPNPAARALARLSDRLGQRLAAMLIYLATPVVTPTPPPTRLPATRTPTATSEPTLEPTPTDTFPSPTPTATPTPEFSVAGRESVCLSSGTPQIRVTVQDAEGQGLPGVDVWITWDGGADRLVTGLKPEISPGFGDFDMQLDVRYSVGAGTQSALALASNLRADPCTTPSGDAGRLSWNIVLRPTSQ